VEFPVAIHKDPDSCYGVTVPDIPGVFSAGDTVDEAMKNTREAIYSHVSILIEDGLDVSLVPSPIGDLIPNPDFAGAIWAYVEVDLSKLDSRPERINISLPRFVLHKIDSYVEARHETRSGFLARVALEAIANG
jgi:predicted RNase H-like HicB family nuclease